MDQTLRKGARYSESDDFEFIKIAKHIWEDIYNILEFDSWKDSLENQNSSTSSFLKRLPGMIIKGPGCDREEEREKENFD